MLRKLIWTALTGLALLGFASSTLAADAPAKTEKNDKRAQRRAERQAGKKNAAGKGGWKLAVQTYTWNKVTFLESIDRAKQVGVKYVEGFAWQKIGGDAGDAKLNPDAPEAAIAAAQKKLKDDGAELISYYVADFGKDDAAHRKLFQFANKMGIKQFVAEPDVKTLDALEPLAKEYKVRIAIHNHPKHGDDAKYTNWDPANVMKLIENRNRFIGVCADTGHWVRSGLDPVEGLKKYKGRIFSLHLKDVNEKGPAGHDVIFGQGISKVDAQLQELADQGFNGIIAIEYEHNMDNNVPDVKACIEYLHKAAEKIGTKVAAR